MLGLGFLFRRAQATVDNAIAQLVWALLIAVPLIVAIGFATAAASAYLHRLYEPEMANLMVAGAYALLTAGVAIVYALRRPGPALTDGEAEAAQAADQSTAGDEKPSRDVSSAERDMLLTALTTAAPIALRPVMAALFRNLPIVLAIAVGAFILSRGAAAINAEAPQPAAE